LEELRNLVGDDTIEEYNGQRDKLTKLLLQEEGFWKQRSKAHWLKGSDMSTKYFRTMALTRKTINELGVWRVRRGGRWRCKRGFLN